MSDKMMRIAGRGTDGLAKAIRTDVNGNLQVKPAGSIVREQIAVITYTALQIKDGRGGTGYQYHDIFLKGNKTAFILRSFLKDAEGLNVDCEVALMIGPSKFPVKHITNFETVRDNAFGWTTVPYDIYTYQLIDENTEGWEYINSGAISDCRFAVRYKGNKIPTTGSVEILTLSV